MICVERSTQKKIEFQMGIETMTFSTLVRCSNQWATENSAVSKSIVGWHNYCIAQSHVKWTHNINCIAQSSSSCLTYQSLPLSSVTIYWLSCGTALSRPSTFFHCSKCSESWGCQSQNAATFSKQGRFLCLAIPGCKLYVHKVFNAIFQLMSTSNATAKVQGGLCLDVPYQHFLTIGQTACLGGQSNITVSLFCSASKHS